MTKSADVVIVGGGIVGCALARELAGRGAGVMVMERGEPGSEASGAAAGLLAPQAEALPAGPLFDLALGSRSEKRRGACWFGAGAALASRSKTV